MIFVDGQNLFHSAKDEGVEIDFVELQNQLEGDKRLIRSYWFDSVKEDLSDKRRGFFDFLRTNGFRVVTFRLDESGDDLNEKGSDISLACEMLHLAHIDAYDAAVLVSGDGDFSGAVQKIQDTGKVVRVASFDDYLSSDLNKVSDETVLLDEITPQIRREDDAGTGRDQDDVGPFLELDE